MDELIKPNWHVALMHFPLALLATGVLIELFSLFWRRSSARVASKWMILLGALAAIPVSFSGVYAYHDALNQNADYPTEMWQEMRSADHHGWSAPQAEAMREHILFGAIGTGAAAGLAVFWLGCSDAWRKRLHLPVLLLLALSMGVLGTAAHHGGEAVYQHGTSVEIQPEDQDIDTIPDKQKPTLLHRIEQAAPPTQTHVTGAGVAVALALLSIGLSWRKSMGAGVPLPPEADDLPAPASASAYVNALRGGNATEPQPLLREEFIPAGRFWLLTLLVSAGAMAGGVWTLAHLMGTWKPQELWAAIQDPETRRRLAHTISGLLIVALPLILALLARFAPRRRLPLAIASILLLLAIGLQVWLGILLLFDGPMGPLTGWQPMEEL